MPNLSDLLAGGTKILRPTGGCHSCPRKFRDYVPATIGNHQVIFVGEAPGQTEVEVGEGFRGKSGQLLRDQLHKVGIRDYSLTNTIHCRPPQNKNPTKREIQCCMNQFVLSEVTGFPFVVLVGSVPMNAFFPDVKEKGLRMKSKNLRGNLAYHPDFPGQRFYGLVHPAAVLRNPNWREAFERHTERLARILDGEADAKHKVITGNQPDFLERLKKDLDSHNVVSVDVETNRLEIWEPDFSIRSFAVAVEEDAGYFVHKGQPVWEEAGELLKQKLMKRDSWVVGHNLGFDGPALEKEFYFNIRAEGWLDTQVLYYLLKGWTQTALKNLVSRELDGYRHLIYSPSNEQDMHLVGKYNVEDVVYPLQLIKKGVPQLNPNTRDLFMRVFGPSSHWLGRITTVGVNFDVDLWEKRKKELVEKRKKVLEKWKQDDPDFKDYAPRNPRDGIGTKKLHKYVFSCKRLPVVRSTSIGNPQVDNQAIQMWINSHNAPYLRNLIDLRSVDKDLDTYVEPYEGHVASDGRVHPSYNNTRVKTGRLSSENPNFQNLKRGPSIRNFFVPRLGWVMGQADASQIELRIAMSLADDPTGIAAYNRGEDLHMETGRLLAALAKRAKVTKDDRQNAKPVNFGLIYGGSWATLQAYARVQYGVEFTDEEAQQLADGFFHTYTALGQWHKTCLMDFRANRGWVENVAGFVARWPEWDHQDHEIRQHAERSALNMRVQGPAAYITIYTGILADRVLMVNGMRSRIIGTIHDSIVWESPEKELDGVVKIVDGCVQEVAKWVKPWFKVPLVFDYEAGPALGALEKLPKVV